MSVATAVSAPPWVVFLVPRELGGKIRVMDRDGRIVKKGAEAAWFDSEAEATEWKRSARLVPGYARIVGQLDPPKEERP